MPPDTGSARAHQAGWMTQESQAGPDTCSCDPQLPLRDPSDRGYDRGAMNGLRSDPRLDECRRGLRDSGRALSAWARSHS